MDIADDGDWCGDVHDVRLPHQDLLCPLANLLDERLTKQLLLE